MDRAFVIIHKTESTFGSDDGKISSFEEKSAENKLLQKIDIQKKMEKIQQKRRQLKACGMGERLGDSGRDLEEQQLDS